MKPDPLDTAVVSHRMDDCAVQQRSHRSKDRDGSPTDTHSSHSVKSSDSHSPRNSDVIFESWDMVRMIITVDNVIYLGAFVMVVKFITGNMMVECCKYALLLFIVVILKR